MKSINQETIFMALAFQAMATSDKNIDATNTADRVIAPYRQTTTFCSLHTGETIEINPDAPVTNAA